MGPKSNPSWHTPIFLIVVEGLDAENIPGAEELVCLGIPNDKGIHAAQALQQPGAPLLIAVQQDLAACFWD